jgi:pimeloyl-ACP methyl ester carboxylesterase
VHELRRRYGFTQFAVVAHSMGGLVTRSFVQRLHAHFPEDEKALRIVITINSPQGGMASATTGVEYSPIVIPSWQDVAAGSAFLKALDERGWPKSIPYHLVFSYEGEKNGDGTVVLPSQIPVALQSDATRIYGFEDTHTSTLADKRFLELMNRLLAESVAARPAAMQPSWFEDWLGKWIGPEGTFLELARQGDGYVVTIQSLDGSARYDGRAVKDHIEFRRDGKTEAIRATSGKDTGMKWLLDKQRCLTVKAGEGYCRG